MESIEKLLGLAGDLGREGVEYALCGKIAVAIHGDHPRFSEDIDLLANAGDLERVRALARGRGFGLDGMPVLLCAGRAGERELVRFADADGANPFTLALVHSRRLLAWALETRTQVSWRSHEVQVVSLDGLHLMTILTDPRHGDSDIEALERTDRKRRHG